MNLLLERSPAATGAEALPGFSDRSQAERREFMGKGVTRQGRSEGSGSSCNRIPHRLGDHHAKEGLVQLLSAETISTRWWFRWMVTFAALTSTVYRCSLAVFHRHITTVVEAAPQSGFARLVSSLCSHESAYITGSVVRALLITAIWRSRVIHHSFASVIPRSVAVDAQAKPGPHRLPARDAFSAHASTLQPVFTTTTRRSNRSRGAGVMRVVTGPDYKRRAHTD